MPWADDTERMIGVRIVVAFLCVTMGSTRVPARAGPGLLAIATLCAPLVLPLSMASWYLLHGDDLGPVVAALLLGVTAMLLQRRGVSRKTSMHIDIGIEMKVTPIEITNDRTRVRVETSRSFLTEDGAGNFQEGLSTLRQKVAAAAEVGFGETLILSGLSESVEDNTFSMTPLLGDLPMVGAVFNERSKQSRCDAALRLITPELPGSLPAWPQIRADAIAKIARLWTEVVDPGSNSRGIGTRLSRVRLFTRAQPNDSPQSWPSLREQSLEALRELVLPHVD